MKYIPCGKNPRWGAGCLDLLTDRYEIERKLVVEDDIEERAVHVHAPVVVEEAQLSELVHEEADP